MKKITLIFSALLAGIAMQAQDGLVAENSTAYSQVERGSSQVLHDRPVGGTGGIVSDVFDGLGAGVYSADDFELEVDAELSMIRVYGFQSTGAGTLESLLLGLEVYIYEDNGGAPAGTPLGEDALYFLEYNAADAADALDADSGGYDFFIDVTGENIVLEADTRYWLSVAPVVDLDAVGGLRWNWFQSMGGHLNSAHLIDEFDLFGGSFTSWTAFGSLGVTWNELSMTLEGTELEASVNDNLLTQVAVYPNPANEVIYLNTPATLEVTNVALYDILGKNTGATLNNGAINISSLARGVYMLNIETNQGSITKKIMKR